MFTLVNAPKGETLDIQPYLAFGIYAPLARRSLVGELGQELLERRFARSISGLDGFIKDR